MDLTRSIIYRGFTLNDSNLQANIIPGPGAGTGITGCVIESATLSDVDVVQFMEKRAQGDGMDVGTPFLGVRRIRLSGVLYAVSRALLYDALTELRAALNPILASREEPLDYGYRPFYFSWPTNRADDYPTGAIDLQVRAMPRAIDTMFDRHTSGGDDLDALAMHWQATLICRDPGIYGASAVETNHGTQTEVTGATATASTDLIGKAAHGLVAGNRVRITSKGTGGAGLSTTTTYYVISSGLTTGAFKVSTTSGGSAVDITSDSTGVKYVKSLIESGTVNNRGTFLAHVNGLWEVGAASGQISGTIGDSTFTIAIPASTGNRIIRFKGRDSGGPVLTVEENLVEVDEMDWLTFSGDTTWPLIDPGPNQPWSLSFHGGILQAGSRWWFYESFA